MIQDNEELPGRAHRKDEEEKENNIRFSPEEELSLLENSNSYKAQANLLFSQNAYNDAIETYNKALSCCPNYRDYEIAVLNCNLAAGYLGIQNWKEATRSATSSLDRLNKVENNYDLNEERKDKESLTVPGKSDKQEAHDGKERVEEADEEDISAAAAAKVEQTSHDQIKKFDIEKIKTKALMRRAKANYEMGGWSALQSAQEDYKLLSQMSNLSPADRKIVEKQLVLLPPKTKAAQDKEIGDLMGQLKTLGNGILKPFGLSTENFQMQKDDKTGAYSMNFKQN